MHNGGRNKSHGQVEATPRVDSFAAGQSGALLAWSGGRPIMFDCCHGMEHGPDGTRELATVALHGRRQMLELTRIRSGFGGSRAFWLCPTCGQRARYLYYTGGGFLCRKCARLNYRCQQETRSGPLYYYHKGMAYAEKHLRPLFLPYGPGGFDQWTPPPPRYMHEPTYRRYLARLQRYQQRHAARQEKQEAQQIRQLRRQIIAAGGVGLWQQIERAALSVTE